MKSSQKIDGVPVPLYRRVADAIRATIETGAMAPGDAIASEHQLAAHYRVSRITVRRALDDLSREGLIERSRGRNARIRRLNGMSPVLAMQRDDIKNLLALARDTEVIVLKAELMPISRDVSSALQIPVEDQAFFSRRIRLHNKQPFSLSDAWVPAQYATEMDAAALARQPMLTLMAAAGAVPARTDQAIAAVGARDFEARALDVVIGTPLLEITRTLRNAEDKPIQHLRMLFRSDRYCYYMTMIEGQPGGDAGMLL